MTPRAFLPRGEGEWRTAGLLQVRARRRDTLVSKLLLRVVLAGLELAPLGLELEHHQVAWQPEDTNRSVRDLVLALEAAEDTVAGRVKPQRHEVIFALARASSCQGAIFAGAFFWLPYPSQAGCAVLWRGRPLHTGTRVREPRARRQPAPPGPGPGAGPRGRPTGWRIRARV